jgi:hypothetical protein
MTTPNQVGERHLSAAGLDKYLASDLPYELPIAGRPSVSLFIDPQIPEMGLRVYDTGDERLSPLNLQHLVTRRTLRDGKRCLEVVITLPWVFRDSYPLLCAIADRIQLEGLRPADALRQSLRQLSLLLRQNDTLTTDREVGLIGELLTLGGLIDSLGPDAAVATWRGGLAEEHDFGLLDFDLEVKTTRAEKRVHWIESLTQLVNTGDRPLWLLSHQLTKAGAGPGVRLPELIELVRRAIGVGAALDAFETGLAGAGWGDDLASSCDKRWAKRTVSRAYAVVDRFPRLTPGLVATEGIDLARLREVKYQIDLDALPASDRPPAEIQAAISYEGKA